jgi:hypothetical protein
MNNFFVSLAGFLCEVIALCPNQVLYVLILTPNFCRYNFYDIPNFTVNDLHSSQLGGDPAPYFRVQNNIDGVVAVCLRHSLVTSTSHVVPMRYVNFKNLQTYAKRYT